MKTWPQDYQTWEGPFEDLVTTAASIIQQSDPQAKPLTPRLVRHYIQEGVISRGTREGRSARFGYQDLASLVAAKSLVKDGWGIKHAAGLLNNAPMGYATTTASASAQSSTTPAAVDVVRELMGKSGPHPLLSCNSANAVLSTRGLSGNAGGEGAQSFFTRGIGPTQPGSPLDATWNESAGSGLPATHDLGSSNWPLGSTGTGEEFLRRHGQTPVEPAFLPYSSPAVEQPSVRRYMVSPLAHQESAPLPQTRTVRHDSFAPWLSVQVDDAGRLMAPPADRAAALDALIEWARQQR